MPLMARRFRAMRALKRAVPYAATASIKSIPLSYWRILFPEAWWDTIKAESAKNNLDPYLVASLIRQESEFNPSAISHANAYGLMQLLPSVGKAMAREEGISHFETFQLLDPATNIRLGTRYLRKTLDKFGGVTEYALAAYNAGDDRVSDWQSAGPYHGIDEFVESIPFTETREYVEAILRNGETYRLSTSSQRHRVAGEGRALPGREPSGREPESIPLRLRFRLTSASFPETLSSTGGSPASGMPFAACCCCPTGPAWMIGHGPVTAIHRRAECQPICSFWKNGFPRKWTLERFLSWKTRPNWVMRRTPSLPSCLARDAERWGSSRAASSAAVRR